MTDKRITLQASEPSPRFIISDIYNLMLFY